VPRLRFAALFTEDESPQLITKALYLCRVVGRAEPLCKPEERLFFLFMGFDPFLNELHQDPVIAETAPLSYAINLLRNLCRQCHAATNLFS